MYTAVVITVSDRSFRRERTDASGPQVASILTSAGFQVRSVEIVPDEKELISAALVHQADDLDTALIITTGGTGLAPRDVTPEATLAVCERLVPGIPEVMRMRSLACTERAMLSRGVAGIRNRSLVINVPGSPKAASENLEAVIASLEHALRMLRGEPSDCAVLAP
jgi:molybdopterin adenylyltransferase